MEFNPSHNPTPSRSDWFTPGPLPRRLFTLGGLCVEDTLSVLDSRVLDYYHEWLEYEESLRENERFELEVARWLRAGLVTESAVDLLRLQRRLQDAISNLRRTTPRTWRAPFYKPVVWWDQRDELAYERSLHQVVRA